MFYICGSLIFVRKNLCLNVFKVVFENLSYEFMIKVVLIKVGKTFGVI